MQKGFWHEKVLFFLFLLLLKMRTNTMMVHDTAVDRTATTTTTTARMVTVLSIEGAGPWAVGLVTENADSVAISISSVTLPPPATDTAQIHN